MGMEESAYEGRGAGLRGWTKRRWQIHLVHQVQHLCIKAWHSSNGIHHIVHNVWCRCGVAVQ